jgi:glutamate racemase
MNNAPIGIFDSGSGGLSVYRCITNMLPHESIVYLGDHLNLPYGNKSTDFIKKRVNKCIKFLIKKRVKLIVIACNTATVAGIDYFRSENPGIPIVGVVPVVKTAAEISVTKKFVVLSTQFTANSTYQNDLINKWAPDCTVYTIGSSRLVPLIEKGLLNSPEISQELQTIFKKIKHIPFDVVALGCTHFPFVRSSISAIVGDGVKILDSGSAVARQVQRILEHRNELSGLSVSKAIFYTTGTCTNVRIVFRQLLDKKTNVSHAIV